MTTIFDEFRLLAPSQGWRIDALKETAQTGESLIVTAHQVNVVNAREVAVTEYMMKSIFNPKKIGPC